MSLSYDASLTFSPWISYALIKQGGVALFLINLIVVFVPTVAVWLIVMGGVLRMLGQQVLLYFTIFIGLTVIATYGFLQWQGVAAIPSPWLTYELLHKLTRGSEAYSHLFICLGIGYIGFMVLVVCRCFSPKMKAEKIYGNAHFASAYEIKRANMYSAEGIVLGKAYDKKIRLPGYESVLVVAPTGSGKTSAIAVPNLLEWQGSGVFNDLKGELYRLTAKHREQALGNQCYLWAPASTEQGLDGYNPFYYVSKNPELRIRDLQLIAEVLIPETKLGDGFWYQSSREMFLTLSLYLIETKGMATLSEIHGLSKRDNFFTWLSEELLMNKERFSVCLQQNATAILGAEGKTRKSILKDFHSRIGLFADPIIARTTSKNTFDFRLMRKKRMSIYIQIPDADKERLSQVLTLFWAQFINVMSEHVPGADEPHGVLALMDEFGNMAKINKLREGLSFLRSYHIRSVIMVQYLSQIVATYGRDEAKGFFNCKVKVAFALNDIDDAQFFSNAMGKKTVRVTSSSISSGHGDHGGSRSASVSYTGRALMSPDEIMRLPTEKALILIESMMPIKADKCYWFKQSFGC